MFWGKLSTVASVLNNFAQLAEALQQVGDSHALEAAAKAAAAKKLEEEIAGHEAEVAQAAAAAQKIKDIIGSK